MATLTLSQIKKINGLSNNEIRLLDEIVFKTKKQGYCWASNSTLAKSANISARSVQRYIKKFIDMGILVAKFIYGETKYHVKERKLFVAFGIKQAPEQPKPEVKPEVPTTPEVAPEQPETPNYHIPAGELLEQDQPRLSDTNHNAYVIKFNRQPSQKLVDFEVSGKGHDAVLYQVIMRTKIENVKTDLDSYLIGGAINELGKNVVVDKEIASGEAKKPTKVIRQEIVPDWLKQGQQTTSERSLTDDDNAKIERMKVLQEQMLNTKRMW